MTDTGETAFWTIFAVVFLDLLGFGLVIPILPLYAKSYGATPTVVGLLIAIYSAMLVLSSPILGRISDHYGRRPVLLISIGGYAVAWILFGIGGSLVVLFLSRIIAGITGGNIAPAQAYIADITPEDDRADRLGLLGAAFGLGFIFGPGIGGMLSSEAAVTFARSFLPAYIPINQFSLPAFAAAALSLINFVFTLFYLPETRNQTTIDKRSQIRQLRDALAEPGLRTLIIAFFIYSLAFSGMQGMFVLLTEAKFGMGTTANGYLLSFMGVIAAVMQGAVVGKLVDRFGEKLLAQAGASLESLALILLPFTPVLGLKLFNFNSFSVTLGIVALLAILLILGIGQAMTVVSLNTLVSFTAPDDEQGGAFGLTQSAGGLARAIGPGVAGVLYSIMYWSPFVAGGLLFLPVIYLLWQFERRD